MVPGGITTAQVKQWSDDRAKFGFAAIVVACNCGCGERMPQHMVADHLDSLPAAICQPVPSGEAQLAKTPRRKVWADAEVLSVNGEPVDEPVVPADGEIGCRCGQWAGPELSYPRHAVTCDAVYELAEQRYQTNQAWLRENMPHLADPHEPIPVAVPASRGGGQTPGEEIEVQDAKSWASGASVISDPAIDPDAFEDEVPAFLQSVAAGFDSALDHFGGLADYLTGAQFDPGGQTHNELHGLIEALDAARQRAAGMAKAAESYIASLTPHPDFTKV